MMLKAFIKEGIDLFWPQDLTCNVCQKDLEKDEKDLCPGCVETIRVIGDTVCKHCGKPIDQAVEAHAVYGFKCKECQEHFSYFKKHRSYALYEGGMKKSLMDLKYKGKTHHLKFLIGSMNEVIGENADFQDVDYVIPVPIHILRRTERGYNQTEFLAKGICDSRPSLTYSNVLKRSKPTKKLKILDKEARKLMLKDAIILNKKVNAPLEGKRVLLVDDIYTTGTTLDACAKTLYEAGVDEVMCITVAMGY